MQLSRKPTLSLLRGQHSRADHVGAIVPWIASGDEAAFRLFFESTNGLLFGLLLRILGHTQSAEEVLTELYEEVRQRAAQFGKQNERPLTWLILMAHRRASKRLCRQLTTNSETYALARRFRFKLIQKTFNNEIETGMAQQVLQPHILAV